MRCDALPAALLLVAVSSGCADKSEPEPVLRPVRYQPVYASGGTRTRSFSGVAESSMQTALSFKVQGTIQQLPVKVGDQVRSAQLIAELDPKDYELQVEDAQAGLERAEAERRNAESNYERTRALYENRNASRNDLDAARSAFESSLAAVTSAEKKLEMASLQLEYTKLRAPLAGAIASVPVEVNENVNLGQTVALLEAGSTPEVQVGIPGVLIARIREGDPVSVKFDAIPGRSFPAVVIEVGVATTRGATTFPVKVRLTAADAGIRSGMAAEVGFTFTTVEASEHFYVPPVAVGEDRAGRFVFVVEPQGDELGLARRRNVTVGELTQDGIEVREGLADGDLLVTAGVSRITDGQQVRLLEPQAAATP
jgi:RND family efflux transporter MFP subunit